MLVLSRKLGESVMIGRDIEVTIVEIKGDRVRLGFRAPSTVKIFRQEILERLGDPPASTPHPLTRDESPYFVECA